jgi:hypothetical protein
LDRSGYITVIGDGTLEVETFQEGNTVMVGELEDKSNLYELTDMYKRMLLSWDCRVYPKDVNEDVLDENGTWTRNYDDDSTESSSTASTYENVRRVSMMTTTSIQMTKMKKMWTFMSSQRLTM